MPLFRGLSFCCTNPLQALLPPGSAAPALNSQNDVPSPMDEFAPYEALPYPPRDPRDEAIPPDHRTEPSSKSQYMSPADELARPVRGAGRGGGTGDACIMLARSWPTALPGEASIRHPTASPICEGAAKAGGLRKSLRTGCSGPAVDADRSFINRLYGCAPPPSDPAAACARSRRAHPDGGMGVRPMASRPQWRLAPASCADLAPRRCAGDRIA